MGECLYTLRRHLEPVYSIAFCPSGEYLASGGFDSHVYVWSMRDGSLLRQFRANGGIFDMAWTASGERLACCTNSNSDNVVVLDMRF